MKKQPAIPTFKAQNMQEVSQIMSKYNCAVITLPQPSTECQNQIDEWNALPAEKRDCRITTGHTMTLGDWLWLGKGTSEMMTPKMIDG